MTTHSLSKQLLKEIEMKESDFYRFRGIFLDNEYAHIGNYICVETRLGGGNREYYENEINEIRKNKYYAFDEDGDFDSTYAYFYFRRQ